MKTITFFWIACAIVAAVVLCFWWPITAMIAAVLLLLLGGVRLVNFMRFLSHRKQQPHRRGSKARVRRQLVVTVACLLLGLAFLIRGLTGVLSSAPTVPVQTPSGESPSSPSPVEPPPPTFAVTGSSSADPSKWGVRWETYENGRSTPDFERAEPIEFACPEEYFSLPGIAAFRANPYRDQTTYGVARVEEEALHLTWTAATSTLEGSTWSGSGWTGQPLIVQWDAPTKAVMNLYEEKQQKEDLVEVIYATLDGHIYFLDAEDGSATRDPLYVGMCFKGAGSLDPRGYPLMYVGSGDVNAAGERPRMFIISLIDGTILYQYGHEEAHALREDHDAWCAFDSSPLVDAATDTLIWPGENGLLYTIKLNSVYDADNATVSVSPETPVFSRYHTARSGEEAYWYGFEASPVIVGQYLYVSENGGLMYCVDLNTMELMWAQDTKDDSNGTPVFERVSETEGYVYTAPSLHWTQDENATGTVAVYKLDAVTGEIVWETPFDVHTVEGVSGGVQSTSLLGKKGTTLEGLLIVTVSRTPDVYSGCLVALDTVTGEEVWRVDMDHYAWSSPVALYEEDGTGYVVVCDSAGYARLFNAAGEQLSVVSLGGLVEATPSGFGNQLVVGTRDEQICCITVS